MQNMETQSGSPFETVNSLDELITGWGMVMKENPFSLSHGVNPERFVGKKTEVTRLQDALKRDNCAVLMGGSHTGKTSIGNIIGRDFRENSLTKDLSSVVHFHDFAMYGADRVKNRISQSDRLSSLPQVSGEKLKMPTLLVIDGISSSVTKEKFLESFQVLEEERSAGTQILFLLNGDIRQSMGGAGVPEFARTKILEFAGRENLVVNRLMADQEIRDIVSGGKPPVFSEKMIQYLVRESGGHPNMAGCLAFEAFSLLRGYRGKKLANLQEEFEKRIEGSMGMLFRDNLSIAEKAGYDALKQNMKTDSKHSAEVFSGFFPRFDAQYFHKWLRQETFRSEYVAKVKPEGYETVFLTDGGAMQEYFLFIKPPPRIDHEKPGDIPSALYLRGPYPQRKEFPPKMQVGKWNLDIVPVAADFQIYSLVKQDKSMEWRLALPGQLYKEDNTLAHVVSLTDDFSVGEVEKASGVLQEKILPRLNTRALDDGIIPEVYASYYTSAKGIFFWVEQPDRFAQRNIPESILDLTHKLSHLRDVAASAYNGSFNIFESYRDYLVNHYESPISEIMGKLQRNGYSDVESRSKIHYLVQMWREFEAEMKKIHPTAKNTADLTDSFWQEMEVSQIRFQAVMILHSLFSSFGDYIFLDPQNSGIYPAKSDSSFIAEAMQAVYAKDQRDYIGMIEAGIDARIDRIRKNPENQVGFEFINKLSKATHELAIQVLG